MKTISRLLFFAILLFFNSAFADIASDAEKLFNWGEQKYPKYFSTEQTKIVTQVLDSRGYKWYYRYYPQTKIYFITNKLSKAYVLGGVFGDNLLYVGTIQDLLNENTDVTPPVITLLGNNPVSVNQGSTYNDAGATATDDVDESVKVTTSGLVDTSKVGTYSIAYTATDKAGNQATATRTVNVVGDEKITYVSNSSELRAALENAKSNGKDDIIVLSKGTYKTTDDGKGTFTFSSNEDYNLTIKSADGLSRDDVVLDGDNTDSIINLNIHGKTVKIVNLTIKNGVSNNKGGGINFGNGIIIIQDSNISNNKAISEGYPSGDGGGIYTYNGNIEVYNSIISDNSVNDSGGGLYTYNGSIILKDSTLDNNQARFAGALWVYEGDLHIDNSSIINNHSTSYGGGALMFDGNVYVNNSKFYNNKSDSSNGGGLLIQGNTDSFNKEAIVVNTLFAKNSCAKSDYYRGCGFYSRRNKTILINSTFVNNSDDGFAGQGILVNNIFDNNLSDIQLDGESKLYNNYFNTTKIINPSSISVDENNIEASTNNLSFTDTEYRLPSDSITIDKGLNPESDTFKNLFTTEEYKKVMQMMQTDKDGKSRIVNGNIDLGAYEVQTTSSSTSRAHK